MPAPPGSATLEQEIQLIHKRLDELTRRPPPPPPPPPFSCRVTVDSNVNLVNNMNTLAQTGWSTTAQDDLSGAFTPSPAIGTPCYITIPADGFYLVNFHASCLGPSAQVAANKVQRNNTVPAGNSIATDAIAYPPIGGVDGDGAVLNAYRARVKLFAGDTLYWSVWTSATATLQSSYFGVPTEMTVQFFSAQ